jgi:tetratricopeptide (TPR) repeat protein
MVDTDNVNAQMMQDKGKLADAVRQNQELTAEVQRLNKEMEQLRQKYAEASTDKERQQIRVEVRQNEAGFAATQLNEQGAKLFAKGRYGEAVTVFTQAIAKNPRYAYAYHNRGTAYGKMQQYGEAVSDFTQAINIEPNYATAYGGRGFAYYGMEDYAHAAADFGRAIELNPQYAEAYYGRGNAYMSMQHYPEALQDYEQALRLNPQLEAARINRDMILQAS